MAHFAELDANNVVLRVIVVLNEDCLKDGVEDEATGIDFCKRHLGSSTRWVQTSYNDNFRVRYAGIGDVYDVVNDVFIPISPYPSWTLNESSWDWDPPVPYPTDGKTYSWDEGQGNWIEV